jgi:N-acetylmuramoyl-L-alanine amidase
MSVFLKKAVLALSLCLAVPFSRGEELSVLLSGKYHKPVNGYKVGSSYFLNAKQAGALYDGQVYWHSVSGRVQMSFRGRRLQFLVGSNEAQVDGKPHAMDAAVMLRSNQVFIPLSFFLSEAFEDFTGMDSEFNERTKLLAVDRSSSLGPVRWFSHPDHTRLAFELDKGLSYAATGRGLAGIDINVPLGVIAASEETDVGDGIVAGYALRQEAKAARLQVRLAGPGLKWKVTELSGPRRIVLDIFGDGEPRLDFVAASRPSAGAAFQEQDPAPPLEAPAQRVRRRIMIDAGHGGKDSGAVGRRGTMEKDVNLRVARELAKLLKEDGVFEVLLTRGEDTFVPLADRSRIANEADADLFISIHCNGSPNSGESGYEVYFLSEKASDPGAQRTAEMENAVLELEGKSVEEEQQAVAILHAMQTTENINSGSELAALVARSLQKRVDLENRGVKQAAFYVLRGTYVPAILLEMAFVTNKKDEAKLESKRYRRKLVGGVYAGVLDYARRRGWLKEQGGDR